MIIDIQSILDKHPSLRGPLPTSSIESALFGIMRCLGFKFTSCTDDSGKAYKYFYLGVLGLDVCVFKSTAKAKKGKPIEYFLAPMPTVAPETLIYLLREEYAGSKRLENLKLMRERRLQDSFESRYCNQQ